MDHGSHSARTLTAAGALFSLTALHCVLQVKAGRSLGPTNVANTAVKVASSTVEAALAAPGVVRRATVYLPSLASSACTSVVDGAVSATARSPQRGTDAAVSTTAASSRSTRCSVFDVVVSTAVPDPRQGGADMV
jgi:hypothetical protein